MFWFLIFQVRSVPVSVQQVELSSLDIPTPQAKELRTVETSMRIDAVGSAGFGMSREKMCKHIKAGDVRLNWECISKPTTLVEEGDVISCSGRGRVCISSKKITKKERYALQLIRYS